MNDLYQGINNKGSIDERLKGRTDLRNIYRDFFIDFKDFLVDFVKQSMRETVVAEIPIGMQKVTVHNGEGSGMFLTLKNQGSIECYVNTCGNRGFRLDSGQREQFWVNTVVSAVTISGNTILGIIKS